MFQKEYDRIDEILTQFQSMTSLRLRCIFTNITSNLLVPHVQPVKNAVRFKHIKEIPTPKPGKGEQYRRMVHYPPDMKYTVEPLNTTNLAGRDPITGRVVAKGIGGGIKHKYHWVNYVRDGPKEGPPQVEKVLDVLFDGHRTAKVALVAFNDQLKYIIATENMRPGDLIKTSRFIPRNPVRANEGDAYPLGALQIGTRVHCIEIHKGHLAHTIRAAGTYGTIMRKIDGHVVVQIPGKREIAYNEECMATVGRISNIEHSKTPIGSPNRNRELGNRPRSGLWKRKTGYHGRKIRPLPPMRIQPPPKPIQDKPLRLTLN